jgi:hypothetical protein
MLALCLVHRKALDRQSPLTLKQSCRRMCVRPDDGQEAETATPGSDMDNRLECSQLRANEIANDLKLLGWKERGGHGTVCGSGCEYWGFSMSGPKLEVAFFDFTKVVATDMISCRIFGAPKNITGEA